MRLAEKLDWKGLRVEQSTKDYQVGISTVVTCDYEIQLLDGRTRPQVFHN
jgi:hypothetical protein